MKVLITGATGLLGTHLIRSVPEKIDLYGTVNLFKKTLPSFSIKYVNLDVRDREKVSKTITKIKPDVVIHTAAHGRVDYCEDNKRDAYDTNVLSVKHLVEELNKTNSKIIFCSTNMTFDGLNPPYSETSVQKPTTYYGKTKVEAEEIILNSKVNHTIVRLMTMYGWNWQPTRKNMISMLIEKLEKKQSLFMTNDIYNNMLYVGEAADFFWKCVLDHKKSDMEIFNIAGSQCNNRYEATVDTCEVFGLDKDLVTEVDSSYFAGQEVPRAPNTCFDTSKVEEEMRYKPISMIEGLLKMREVR